jgi:TonB family protein
MMTFQRSLFISISIHVLACGGALAFAQYGHILGNSNVISIVLVGSGSDSEKSLRQTAASTPKETKDDRLSTQKTEAPPEDDIDRIRVIPASVNVSVTDGEIETRSTDVSAGHSATWQEANPDAGSQFGILKPDQWQLIQAALERAKTYPSLARKRGIEGIAHLRFKILPSGAVERVELVKSSGYEILDAASVRTIYQAGPLPYVKGWIEVPIAYHIILPVP